MGSGRQSEEDGRHASLLLMASVLGASVLIVFILFDFWAARHPNRPREMLHGQLEPFPAFHIPPSMVEEEASTVPATDDSPLHPLPGDVFIQDLPMVDQGRLPWCAVASVARILLYYEIDCDLERLAELFGADRLNGVVSETYRAELSRIADAYGLKIRQISPPQRIDARTVPIYNERARSMYKPALYEPHFIRNIRGRRSIDGERLVYALDYDVWRSLMLEDTNRHDTFCAGIEEAIDRKAPLLWQVHLGLVAEERLKPSVRGAHMRLIIGYNVDRQEILFSDSWGERHALKRLPLEDAYLITYELNAVYRGGQPVGY